MKMFINGNPIGTCVHYCQYSRKLPAGKVTETGWKFSMRNGMEIWIPHKAIRFFDSSGRINIHLFQEGAPEK